MLRDPIGNSTIISETAQSRRIGERDLKEVEFGEQAIAPRNVQ
jgi:C4-type Zn-finger protein